MPITEVLNTAPLASGNKYYTAFDIVISLTDIDLSTIDLTKDVNVKLISNYGLGEVQGINYKSNSDIKTITVTFANVQAGEYHIEAAVKDAHGFANVSVNSYEGKPVLLKLSNSNLPVGANDFWLNFQGVNPFVLGTGVSNYSITFNGFYLANLNKANISVVLKDKNSEWTATAA